MKFGLSESDCDADFMSSEGHGSEEEDGASGHEQTKETI